MTCIIGYLRPFVNEQNMPSQLDQLKAAGATRIVQEQAAGVKRDRAQLDKLMEGVSDGDTMIVASLDRIADNTRHLLEIVESLNEDGASLRVIDIGIDTATPHGEALGVEPS